MRAGPSLVIVNPRAGGGRAKRVAPDAIRRLRDGGLILEVHETTAAGEATQVAREAVRQGYPRIIAAGGDGTTFEVINGLLPAADAPLPSLGLLPLGTGNSFLRDFGIESTDDAIDVLLRGPVRKVDVVEATHREGTLFYLNLLSLGFPAEVGRLTNERYKPLGAMGYGLATLGSTFNLEPRTLPIRVDDGPWDQRPCTFLTFSNSRFTGGSMMMAPHADTADGKLDIIRAHAMTRWALLRAFPKIFRGTHVDSEEVEESQAESVELSLQSQDVMVDGEVLQLALTGLRVKPLALNVVG